jgi:hypothetical protein
MTCLNGVSKQYQRLDDRAISLVWSQAVLLINAPAIFPVIWKFLQPFVKQVIKQQPA